MCGDYLHELRKFLLAWCSDERPMDNTPQIHVLGVQVCSRCRRFIRWQNAS